MNQVNGSKEAQDKIIHFLKEEFLKLQTEEREELKKKNMKRKNKNKKWQKLYQKIEATLSINSLDIETINTLRILQQEIEALSRIA